MAWQRLCIIFFCLLFAYTFLQMGYGEETVGKKEIGSTYKPNRLMNGGFEEAKENKPNYWKFFGHGEELLFDGNDHIEGAHSMQIHLKQYSKEGVRLQQEVEVEVGKRYDFGGKMKANLEKGFANIMVILLDKERKEIATYALPKPGVNNDWISQNMWFQSPNGADVAKIICFVKGSGKAWFDDIYFSAKIRGGY